jgi:hypothetical protein
MLPCAEAVETLVAYAITIVTKALQINVILGVNEKANTGGQTMINFFESGSDHIALALGMQ